MTRNAASVHETTRQALSGAVEQNCACGARGKQRTWWSGKVSQPRQMWKKC